jgi:hypothetical protein
VISARKRSAGALWLCGVGAACGTGEDGSPGAGGARLPYAQAVVSFEPGPGAGFGRDEFPDVVLGPPAGAGTGAGALDVLSLGAGGTIVLAFGDRAIANGLGADLVVFENPFWAGGDPASVFAELGEVSVSPDGTDWRTFSCDPAGIGEGRFPGCAGWTPTFEYDPADVLPIDPVQTGGDVFDLEEVGLESARYVRIRDLSDGGEGTSAGFDLDAVGVIHQTPRDP